jgi:ABC-type nitrate/sulfonate/bicarbonate transport system substrate-binding protein
VPSFSRARLIAGAAAVATVAPQIAIAQAPEKIRMCGVPTDDLTQMFYAMKNGMYRDAGLDVEFVATPSGTAATAAVVSGAYELGKGSLIASLVAHLRSLPLTLVANNSVWDRKAPFSQILVASDSSIHTGADCNGKIASTAALNDIAELGIIVWVEKNGGDPRTLKWVEIPNSAGAASLIEHRTDLTALNEPGLSAALDTGKCRILGDGLSAIGDGWVYGVWFAQPEWAAKHRDALRRWVRVTYEAATYVNAHKPETIPMMVEITKMALPTYQKLPRAVAATSSDPALIQPAIDAAAKWKFIARGFPAKEMYFTT